MMSGTIGRSVMVGVVIFLLLVGVASAWDRPSRSPLAASVTVSVREPSGTPVQGAEVSFSDLMGVKGSGRTDASGTYTANIPDGVYNLLVTHMRYAAWHAYVKVVPGFTQDVTLVSVAGETTARVSGMVSDAVTSAGVNTSTLTFRKTDMRYVNSTGTNPLGAYSISLVPGWYLVEVQAPGYFTHTRTLYAGPGTSMNITLLSTSGPFAQISGTVIDNFTGDPASQAKVRIYGPGGWWNETSVSGAGTYTMNAPATSVTVVAVNDSRSAPPRVVTPPAAGVNFLLDRDLTPPNTGSTPSPSGDLGVNHPVLMRGYASDLASRNLASYRFILGRQVRDTGSTVEYASWAEVAGEDAFRTHAAILTNLSGADPLQKVEYNFTWDTRGTFGSIGGFMRENATFGQGVWSGGDLAAYGIFTGTGYPGGTPALALFREDGTLDVVVANLTGTMELVYPGDEPTSTFMKRDHIYVIDKSTGGVNQEKEENGTSTYTLRDITASLSPGMQSGSYCILSLIADLARNSDSRCTVITVDNDPPVAAAGPDLSVHLNDTVLLNGTGSWDNVGVTNYTWTFVDGTPKTLYGSMVNHTFSSEGVFNVTLTVRDAAGNTGSDSMLVTVTRFVDSTPPVAVAIIPGRALLNTTVTFDGSRSSDDVGIINYTWNLTENDIGVRLYGDTVSYKFTYRGVYCITLTVTDVGGNTASDTGCIKVSDEIDTIPPRADAGGDRTVIQKGVIKCPGRDIMSPGVVMLDASASTDSGGEHGIVKYLWTVVSPEGMETHLEGVYVNVTFDTPGEHNVTLYVEDAGLNFDTDRVVITVLPFDSDSDGLPDEWELRHFGSLKERGTGDADVDGRVNVQEACESTDPTRADTVILPESELSGIWWLFLLVGVGVCAGIAGIVYVRRPRLKVLPRPPAGVSPPVSVATAPALAPPEDEEEKEREERELKEILEGRWSRPEDED